MPAALPLRGGGGGLLICKSSANSGAGRRQQVCRFREAACIGAGSPGMTAPCSYCGKHCIILIERCQEVAVLSVNFRRQGDRKPAFFHRTSCNALGKVLKYDCSIIPIRSGVRRSRTSAERTTKSSTAVLFRFIAKRSTAIRHRVSRTGTTGTEQKKRAGKVIGSGSRPGVSSAYEKPAC